MDLSPPTKDLHASVLAVLNSEDLGEGHGMSLELAEDLDLRSAEGFSAWVDRLLAEEHSPREGRVPATNLWLVHAGTYVGSIQLRHTLGTEYLRTRGGHVGYTVRAQDRGKGYATQALEQLMPVARKHGLDRLLVTCLESNPASARVIEKCGGIYEATTEGLKRYWVPVVG